MKEIEKIRAEIERLLKKTNGWYVQKEDLLKLLETLEAESRAPLSLSDEEVFHRLLDRYFNETDDVKEAGRLMQYTKMEVISFNTIRRTEYRLYVKTEVNVEYQ